MLMENIALCLLVRHMQKNPLLIHLFLSGLPNFVSQWVIFHYYHMFDALFSTCGPSKLVPLSLLACFGFKLSVTSDENRSFRIIYSQSTFHLSTNIQTSLDSFFRKISSLFFYIYKCLHICMCTTWRPGAQDVQKKASDPLDLELQMIVNSYLGSEK